MSLQGLPDLQRPIHGEGFALFYPFEVAGQHCLLPSHLEVATTDRGKPDFLLELVRGETPALPPTPYGKLAIRVRPSYPVDEALARLREDSPMGTLGFPVFARGFLRLRQLGPDQVPDDLVAPVELGFSGLGIARLMLRLSEASVAVLRTALEDETFGFLASAEVEIEGVSPRLPAAIRVQPVDLLTRLRGLAEGESRVVERSRLVDFFSQDLDELPFELDGILDSTSKTDLAEAAADRVRLHWGRFAPSPGSDARPSLELADPGEVESAQQEWDLSAAVRVPRPFGLALDPLAAARQVVAIEGPEALVRETVVPVLNTGAHDIAVTANLPHPRPGILASGVTLRAAARPPHRFHSIERTARLVAPEDAAVVRLELSALEPLTFTATTFLVARTGARIEQLEGTPIASDSDRIDLGPADYPVRFYPVAASDGLLGIATLHGICHTQSDLGAGAVEFELTAAQPRSTVLLPIDVEPTRVEIEARELAGPGVVTLDLPAGVDLSLDLHSFAEYGSHNILISWEFAPESPPLAALDLLPDEHQDSTERMTVLSFSPERPEREWSYLASSPFRAGFRYRNHSGPDESPHAWSESQSPFDHLQLGTARAVEVQR